MPLLSLPNLHWSSGIHLVITKTFSGGNNRTNKIMLKVDEQNSWVECGCSRNWQRIYQNSVLMTLFHDSLQHISRLLSMVRDRFISVNLFCCFLFELTQCFELIYFTRYDILSFKIFSFFFCQHSLMFYYMFFFAFKLDGSK